MTYGKYIKSQLMGYDSRFRLHPVWMMWSYMQLEKLRNFQNTARIYRQLNNSTHSSLSAIQWLRKSHYTNEMMVDENLLLPHTLGMRFSAIYAYYYAPSTGVWRRLR